MQRHMLIQGLVTSYYLSSHVDVLGDMSSMWRLQRDRGPGRPPWITYQIVSMMLFRQGKVTIGT